MSTLGDGYESLCFSHIHSLGLQQSYIPLIFTSLPVILILGLAFFGLTVFLFELGWPVAIPAAIAIGFTFVFLLTSFCTAIILWSTVERQSTLFSILIPIPTVASRPSSERLKINQRNLASTVTGELFWLEESSFRIRYYRSPCFSEGK